MAKRFLVISVLLVLTILTLLLANNEELLNFEVVTEQYPPFNYEKDGIVRGIATEKVEAVLKDLNISPDIRVMRWSRAYRRALRRKNIIIYSIARTPEREDLFHWIGIVAPFEIYLYSLSKRNDIEISDQEDFMKWVIGVVQGDVRDQYFSERGNTDLRRYRNSRDLVNALLNGEVDLIPVNRLNLPYIIDFLELSPDKFTKRFFVEELSQEGLYMALSINSSLEIAELLKKAYQKVTNQ